MSQPVTQKEARSYPLTEINPVDRELFAPVDPLKQANKRGFVVSMGILVLFFGSLGGNLYQFYLLQVQPVRVLSINDTGQAESFSLRLTRFTLHQTETQFALKNAITAWAEGFDSRLRNPVNGEIATRAFPRSLLFMSGELADAYKQREAVTHEVSQFMSSADPEYRAVVTNVVFRNLEKKPYEADLYYDKLYYSQPLTVSARQSYLRTIHFTVNPADDELNKLRQRSGADLETLLKVNPLVLAVTHVGDEQAFSAGPSAR